MSIQNRRTFLTTSSMAIAGAGLAIGSRSSYAIPIRSKQPIYAHMPDIVDPDSLRQLATLAMDVAQSAGASYADIRVADKRTMTMQIMFGQPRGSLGYHYSFGVRVLVNGAWAFGYGADPTPEGVAEVVRSVTNTAKVMARVAGAKPNMPHIPAVTGEWSTPFQIDPFEVSPDEHAYMCGAYMNLGERVPDGGAGLQLEWVRETRVFASTEGTLQTQHLRSARPVTGAGAEDPFGIRARLPFTDVRPMSAGFEVIVGPELQEKLKRVVEETTQLLSYPVGETDVGRFEAVLDGQSVGAILGSTLLPALDLDRALGNQADEDGTSLLVPDEAMLGQSLFSQHLTFRSDRTMPQYGAAKWDDEGVEIKPYTLVQNGAVVDFIGTRANIDALSGWYQHSGREAGPKGAAVAWTAERAPLCSAPAVVMDVGTDGATLDSLVRQVSNGVVLRSVANIHSDQQLTGGLIMLDPPMLFEVKKGRIIRRIRRAMLQFQTGTHWKGLSMLGDTSTVQHSVQERFVGQPWSHATNVITAPAALFSEIDINRVPRYEDLVGKL